MKNIKWHLENIGYRLLLEDDPAVQYAFGKARELPGYEGTYLHKAFLLLKLYMGIHIRKMTPERALEDLEGHSAFPEWRAADQEKVLSLCRSLAGSPSLAVDAALLLWPPARDREKDRFLLEARPKAAPVYVENTGLLSFLTQGGRRLPVYVVMNGFGEDVPASFLQNRSRFRPVLLGEAGSVRDFFTGDEISLPSGKEGTGILSVKDRLPLFQAAGFSACYVYPDIRALGRRYRSSIYETPVLDLYHTLMDSAFHMPSPSRGFFYGMGFKYGGILCLGFCQWLKALCQKEKFDRILFCARDCRLVYETSLVLSFPCDIRYMQVSRRAMGEVFFEEEPEQYVDGFLLHRAANRSIPCRIEDVLRDMELSFLAPHLPDYGLQLSGYLTADACESLKRLILDHYSAVAGHFKNSREAGQDYYRSLLSGAERICVVDIGWHGTASRALRRFAAREGLPVTIACALFGAVQGEKTETYDNALHAHTYLFSDDKRRCDAFYGRPLSVRQIFCFEKMFTDTCPSLLHYYPSFVLKDKNPYAPAIAGIHRGVSDFVAQMQPLLLAMGQTIRMEEAWDVFSHFLNDKKLLNLFYQKLLKGEGDAIAPDEKTHDQI